MKFVFERELADAVGERLRFLRAEAWWRTQQHRRGLLFATAMLLLGVGRVIGAEPEAQLAQAVVAVLVSAAVYGLTRALRSGMQRSTVTFTLEQAADWPIRETWTCDERGLHLVLPWGERFQPWSTIEAVRSESTGIRFDDLRGEPLLLPARALHPGAAVQVRRLYERATAQRNPQA